MTVVVETEVVVSTDVAFLVAVVAATDVSVAIAVLVAAVVAMIPFVTVVVDIRVEWTEANLMVVGHSIL